MEHDSAWSAAGGPAAPRPGLPARPATAPAVPAGAGVPNTGAPGAGAAGPAARAGTGDERVDAALARLDDLAGLPVTEHAAVFEDVHARLVETLGGLATGEDARQAGLATPPQPGGAGRIPPRPGR